MMRRRRAAASAAVASNHQASRPILDPKSQRILSGGLEALTSRGASTAPSRTPSICMLAIWCLTSALPDNQHALSASGDKTVKLFNASRRRVRRIFTHHTPGEVYCLALLPDGRRFVSGSEDKTARHRAHLALS